MASPVQQGDPESPGQPATPGQLATPGQPAIPGQSDPGTRDTQQASHHDGFEPPCFIRWSTAIARTWGMVTVIAIWACMIKLFTEKSTHEVVKWYLLVLSIVITFFEITWLINKFTCCGNEGLCCRLWRFVMFMDRWRKTVLYILLSVPCFVRAMVEVEGVLIGIMLIISGILYFLVTLKHSDMCQPRQATRRDEAVQTDKAALVTNEVKTNETGVQTNYTWIHQN